MNTYEKLIHLATSFYDDSVVLNDERGVQLYSSKTVHRELNKDFFGLIDMRQASETRIIDIE